MDLAHRRLYEVEMGRLDEEYASLEQSWKNVPKFAWFLLLAPILGVKFGVGIGVLALIVTGSLFGMRTYLVGVRVSQNRWTRESLAKELAVEAERATDER